MDRMDMFHLQYSPGCFFCSVSAAQRAQIAQRAICHVSPLLPTEAYQTRNLPKKAASLLIPHHFWWQPHKLINRVYYSGVPIPIVQLYL